MFSVDRQIGHGARGQQQSWLVIGAVASLALIVGLSMVTVRAQSSQTVAEGVYTTEQAQRGQAMYDGLCAACHSDDLQGGLGPPLVGEYFRSIWGTVPLSDLASKIEFTMPEDNPGSLMAQEAADITAYLLQAGGFPAGSAELDSDDLSEISWPAEAPAEAEASSTDMAQMFSSPPTATVNQLMTGIFFPSSNLIFNVQVQDPDDDPTAEDKAASSIAVWGASVYSEWQMVDDAALAIAEAASLLMRQGRRCENGKPVPLEEDAWRNFVVALEETGVAAYRASQSRDREAVIEITDRLATSCADCHDVYRDKSGGTDRDPENRADRCTTESRLRP